MRNLLRIAVFASLVLATPAAHAQISVEDYQKISSTEGGLDANFSDQARFGSAMTNLGDVDGDGVSDVAVGAPADITDDSGQDRGAVFILFLNRDGTVKAQQKLPSAGRGRNFGQALAGLGDVDGDGTPDLAVNGFGFNASIRAFAGYVVVLYLNPDGTVRDQLSISSAPGLRSVGGSVIANVGDVDGDGVNDFVTSGENPSREGGLFLFFSRPNEFSDRNYAEAKFIARASGSVSVAGLGDVDADGVPDLAASAGGTVDVIFLNRDGTVKAQQEISKTDAGLDSSQDDPRDSFGSALAGSSDVNGDGVPDLVVGAENSTSAGGVKGAVYVLFLNRDGEVIGQRAIPFPSEDLAKDLDTDDRFGSSVAGIGDLDGNGKVDLIVGANGDDDGSAQAFFQGRGAAWVLFLEDEASPPLPGDVTPPECEIVGIDPGPPTTLRVRTRDGGSGLASITVRQDKNATVTVPAFTPGVQTNVFVTAEKIDESKRSTVVLEVKDRSGNTTVCDPVVTTVSADVPEAFELGANYPNPFNPTTRIAFKLAEASDVRLAVYDALGREVALLVSDQIEAGSYEVEWEGTDASGRVLPSGVYLYRIEAGAFSESRTMTLVK